MGWILFGLIVVALAVSAFARLGAIAQDQWHVALDFDDTQTLAGGYKTVVVVKGPVADVQSRFIEIATQTPRTTILAQTEDLVSFVTRSVVFGFPDITTASFEAVEDGVKVRIFGRLKIGKSDVGVNKARVQSWVKQLQD